MDNAFDKLIVTSGASHPIELVKQRRTYLLLSVVPLIVLAFIGVVAAYSLDSWRFVLNHPYVPAALVVIAAGLTLGAATTALLVNIIEMRGCPGEIRDDCINFPAWMFWCGLLAFAFPIAFDQLAGVLSVVGYTGSIRFVVYMSALMPFILLMAYVAFSRPGELPHGYRHDRRYVVLALVFIAAATLILLVNVRETIMGYTWPPELGFLKTSLARIIGFAVLVPLVFLCYCLYRLSWVKKRERAGMAADLQDPESDEVQQVQPTWVREFARVLAETCPGLSFSGNVELKKVERPSPPDPEPDEGLKMLMSRPVPTMDQSRYFSRFVSAYSDAANRVCDEGFRNDVGIKIDLILEGPEGSGRTEMLCASALYAAIARGQGVLYIVNGDAETDAVVRRLDSVLVRLGLKGAVGIDVLKPTSMGGWLDSGEVRPPVILVATPANLERCFFANSDAIGDEDFQSLKALLLDYDEILVDDFLSMPSAVRSHLSFILDKIRLVQQSEGRLSQFVIATAPMVHPDGSDRAGDRLFRQLNFDPLRNVIRLAHRQCEHPFWYGVIDVGEGVAMEEAVRDAVVAALKCNLRVLYYNKGISDDVGNVMVEDVRSRVNAGEFSVIARLSDNRVVKEPQAVFYLSLTCGDCGTALRMNVEGEEAVFFKIRGRLEREEEEREMLPLLPDESAAPLCVQHLKSVLRFIDAGVPVNSRTWSLFNVVPSAIPVADGDLAGAAQAEIAWDYDFYVERSRNAYRNGEIWPYLTLVSDVRRSRSSGSVNLEMLPDKESSLYRAGAKRIVLVDRDAGNEIPDVRRHLAVWVDHHGNEIGKSDLSRAGELVLRKDGLEFVVETVLSDDKIASEHGCAVAVRAKPRHWSEEDNVLPMLSLEWQLPVDGVQADESAQPENLLRFALKSDAGDVFQISAGFSGLMNGLGKVTEYPRCAFSYSAYASCIVLNPSVSISADGSMEQVARCMSGNWRTDSESGFSPALTHAITAALRQMMSGWEFFAIAPCFFIEGRDESIGQVVIWFLEPQSSGRTVSPMLMKILSRDSSAFKRELIQLARKELEGDVSMEKLHMASRIAFKGEQVEAGDVAKAIQALRVLAGECERLAPPVKPEHRSPRVRRNDYGELENRFDAYIVQALKAFEPEIDVTEYIRAGWTTDIISDRFEDVRWNNPQIFYVSRTGCKFQWWQDTDGNITRMVIKDIDYAFPASEYAQRKRELDEAVRRFISEAGVDVASGAVQKMLRIHDHIVKICDYDVKAARRHDRSAVARTVFSVLVRHCAVCEGYSMAYRYLLDAEGITSEILISDAMHHCWNYVENDGKWYHVDVTWDDPLVNGRVVSGTANLTHEHFLKSDEAIRSLEHYGWDTRGLPAATDTCYDDALWNEGS